MPKGTLLERAAIDRDRVKNGGQRDFTLFSRGLRAFMQKDASGADQMFIEAIASSTIVDRMGDQMTLRCLEGMKQQSLGMTVWLNHDYTVPESVFGTCVEASIVPATDGEQGACYDFVTRTQVDDTNPRAVTAWKHLNKGTKLGQSVGGQIKEYNFLDPDELWWGGLSIESMDLWEYSIVGVPAVQRAYVDGVAKSCLVASGLRKANKAPVTPEVRDAQKAALARGFDASADPVDDPGNGGGADAPSGSDEPAKVVAPADAPGAGASDAPATEVAPVDQPPAVETPMLQPGAVPSVASVRLSGVDIATVEMLLRAAYGDKVVVKAAKAISDEMTACLQTIRDSVTEAHALNTPQGEHLSSAVDQLSDLLQPGGYDTGDDGSGTPLDPDMAYSSVKAAHDAEIEQLTTLRATLVSQCDALLKTNSQMLTDYATLAAIVRELKAVPMPRLTRSYGHGGGSDMTDPNVRRRSINEIMAEASDLTRGATDARTRSLSA